MNWQKTALTEKLNIRYPIIQAPMAGGISTPELVAAVSNAGGLGSLGAAYLEPENIRTAIQQIRELTEHPFAVNLFIPEATAVNNDRLAKASERLMPLRRELGLPAASEPPSRFLPNYTEQLAVVLEEAPAAFSFIFGVPKPEELEVLKHRNILTIGTATQLLEAIILEESGIDMIIAQGLEAGGHRGTFVGDPVERGMVGTMALLPLLADHIRVPLIAAGGIMDGRGIAAALALGAAGAQLGTAFLACPESGAHPKYKELLRQGTEIDTVVTRVFSGRPGRAIRNRFIDTLQSQQAELADFPIQHALTREILQTAAEQNRPEWMALWAGQGCALCHNIPAAELVADWAGQLTRIAGA